MFVEQRIQRRVRFFRKRLIMFEQRLPLLGQAGAAAVCAARAALEQSKAQFVFAGAQDMPGLVVAHAHGSGCAPNGAALLHAAQQLGHTRPKALASAARDAQRGCDRPCIVHTHDPFQSITLVRKPRGHAVARFCPHFIR